jgi:hydroxyethylthiazole kinase
VPQSELEEAINAIEILRERGARVHCITNSVAQNFTANVLLACGARPSMTVSPEEIEFFVDRCDALLINLGTLDLERRKTINSAMVAAGRRKIPVVLDPVKCDISIPRLDFARRLIGRHALLLKANAAEAAALDGIEAGCRVVTGKVDVVDEDGRRVAVANGVPLMDRLVATGCVLGALIAALCAVAGSYRTGALAGLLWTGVAAELAAPAARGPGSFQVHFIDALASLDAATVREKARLS